MTPHARTRQRNAAFLAGRGKATALAVAAAALCLSANFASATPAPLDNSIQRRSNVASTDIDRGFLARHGDHEHEHEAGEEEAEEAPSVESTTTSVMTSIGTASSNQVPPLPSISSQATTTPHQHSHHQHQHEHQDISAPHIPSEQELGASATKIPFFPHVWQSGHQHVHSDAPAEMELNETKLLEWKGPEPLSYIEWDFGYGLGSAENLRRFASKTFAQLDFESDLGAMAYVDGRFRKLTDEKDPAARKAIAQDIFSRVGDEAEPLQPSRHTWLLVLHVVLASFSCFGLLPLALFLRSASSSLAPLASLSYIATLFGSLLLSSLYKSLTPRLYPDNVHGRMGWAILWMSLVCLGGDIFSLLRQVVQVFRVSGQKGTSKLRALSRIATGQRQSDDVDGEKYSPIEEERILSESPADDHDHDDNVDVEQFGHQARRHHVHFATRDSTEHHRDASSGSASPTDTLVGHGPSRGNSWSDGLPSKPQWKTGGTTSASTDAVKDAIHSWQSAELKWRSDSPSDSPAPPRTRITILRNILRYTHVVVTRAQPIVAFAAAYTGLVVYTGSCRKPNINGCMAHGIKGGIFFWFGLLTFSRYIGAYADCGWAWNRRPSPETAKKRGAGWKASVPSAEWVECLVIFLYGASNTWMERFSAKAGDPYTVKQVQHISIAIMFWFAGALGLMLETRWIRDLLSYPVAATHPSARDAVDTAADGGSRHDNAVVAAQTPPPSYSGSFNPFPALCVGVTGIAMAAHHQDYVYEVQIHMLWGNLLAGFAMLRFLTYFFLWLRPPTSVLPSRPPTEALASFCLTCGGLVFMISSEEVSFAAMRNGFGDFMAILCISVAFICFLFALTAALFVVKAWAFKREAIKGSERTMMAISGRRSTVGQGIDQTHVYSGSNESRRSRARRSSPLPSVTEDGEHDVQAVIASPTSDPVFVLGDDGEDATPAPSTQDGQALI